MVRLYLDIETYRPEKEKPFVNERMIALGIMKDETTCHPISLNAPVEPEIYADWKGMNEAEITSKAIQIVEESLSRYSFTVVCGYDILRFDLPLLIAKADTHGLLPPEQSSLLWHNTHAIDYFQQLLAANSNLFKGLKLNRIVEVARNLGLQPPTLHETGAAILQLYEAKEYAKIEEHLTNDLKVIRWLDLEGAKQLIAASINMGGALFREH